MSLFSWLRGKDDISEMRRFVDAIAELNECQMQNNILYMALIQACAELYKHTGEIKCQPGYFMAEVKIKAGYVEGSLIK